jgi:endonuclease YncB( thermonuclease family)
MHRALALTAILLCLVCVANAEEFHGEVVGISDGDTLTLLVGKTQHRIRLDGIDALERTQPYSQRSKQSLAELAYHRQATADYHKRDKYGRDVCKVLIDGADINLEQIRRGLAWHFKRYEHEQAVDDQRSYAAAETAARAAMRGLWQDRAPKAPWDFRAEKRREP